MNFLLVLPAERGFWTRILNKIQLLPQALRIFEVWSASTDFVRLAGAFGSPQAFGDEMVDGRQNQCNERAEHQAPALIVGGSSGMTEEHIPSLHQQVLDLLETTAGE
jgi:hypothetical protein